MLDHVQHKRLNSLIGILSGVTCDGMLNDTEILYLKTWLETMQNLRGDFLDVYDATSHVLSRGAISSEDRDDLRNMISDIVEYDDDSRWNWNENDLLINRFQGFVAGVVADGIVNDKEYLALRDLAKGMSSRGYPFDVVEKKINEIELDDVVAKEELVEFAEFLGNLSGCRFTKDGDPEGSSVGLFCEPIQFKSQVGVQVVFTGTFTRGTRCQLEQEAAAVWMNPHPKVTQKTKLLVVGNLSSIGWIHTSSGRKIEAALLLRRNQHCNICITNESVWAEFINPLLKGSMPRQDQSKATGCARS